MSEVNSCKVVEIQSMLYFCALLLLLALVQLPLTLALKLFQILLLDTKKQ